MPTNPKDRWEPTIRERADGRGWLIDMGQKLTPGRRKMLSSKTLEGAKAKQRDAADKYERLGVLAGMLKPKEAIWAVNAMQALPEGVTLQQAVEFYVEHHEEALAGVSEAITVGFAIDEVVKNMGRTEKRDRTIQSARSTLKMLFQDISTPVGSYATTDLQARLDQHGAGKSAQTRKNYVTYIKQLFGYCMKLDWIDSDPSLALDKPVVEQKLPEFMTVDGVGSLLRSVDGEPRLQLLLGFFAGIRPEEIKRLKWKAIDVEQQTITIGAEVAKTRRIRHVTIADNLAAWLGHYQAFADELVCPYFDTNNEIRRRAVTELGLYWPADCARHTFATMHFAAYKDAAETAAELGHSNGLDVFYNHYRGLATKPDADLYWGIMP